MEGLYLIHAILCGIMYLTLCLLEKKANEEDEIQVEEASEEFKEQFYALFGERI